MEPVSEDLGLLLVEQFREQMNNLAAAVQLRDPEPDEDLPVLLHNNGFARPCEGIVNMYSPPGKGDIDPTGVMALFFYLPFSSFLSFFLTSDRVLCFLPAESFDGL